MGYPNFLLHYKGPKLTFLSSPSPTLPYVRKQYFLWEVLSVSFVIQEHIYRNTATFTENSNGFPTAILQAYIPVSYNSQGCYSYYREVCLWNDVPCVNFCRKYPVLSNYSQWSPQLFLNSAAQVCNHTQRTWAPACRSACFTQFQSPLFYLHTHFYMLTEVFVIFCKNLISFRKGAQEMQLSYK